MFTKEELTVLEQLISATTIKGGDSIVVAQLLLKIQKLLVPVAKTTPIKPEEKKYVQ